MSITIEGAGTCLIIIGLGMIILGKYLKEK